MDSSTDKDKREAKQSQALSQEMVEAFASLFKGRKDKSGWLRDETTANYIVLPNDKNPEPAPVTLDLYRYHLLGKRWLGIFPLVNDRCRFAAVDLDEENFKKALAFRNTLLEQAGLKAYIAKTKSKGYRIILFFIEPIIAENIILVLNKVVGNPQAKIEVFPKQPYGTFENPGNFFNLPSFGNRCPFLAGDNKPVPLDYVLDHIKFNTEEHLGQALEKIPKAGEPPRKKAGKQEAKKKRHCPCITKILWGVNEGQRDEAAFAIAKYYIDDLKYPPDEVLGLLKVWDKSNNPPFNDDHLLEIKVRSASKKGYPFGCGSIRDNPMLSEFCVGEENCEWWKDITKKREER